MLHLKKSDSLFYLAFVIYYISLFIVYLPIENTESPKKILALASCVCLIVNLTPVILYKIFINKKYLLLVVAFIALLLISLMLKDLFIVITFLFGLNIFFRIEDIKPFFKISFGLLLALTILVILLCFLGLLENVVTHREGVARYSLGFYHSNVLPLILVYLSSYYFIIKKSIDIASFFAFEIPGIIVFFLCNSRNAFLSLQLVLFLAIVNRKMNNSRKYRKFLKIICLLIIPLLSAFALILLYLYGKKNPIAIFCNELFNNRIHMANLYYHYQEFKIINLMSPDRYRRIALTLDNGYFYSVARYGAAFLAVIFAEVYYFTKYAVKKHNNYALTAIVVIAIVNFIDNGFYSFMFYPFIIMSMYGLIHKKDMDINEFISDNIQKLYK